MDAKTNQSGQSVLEFMLALPILIALVVIMIRLNSAMQISIVDQQYARAQTLFLTFNSAFYPELEKHENLISRGANQMVLGVSDNPAPEQGDYTPEASVQLITRSKKVQGSDAPGESPNMRARVRIRNSVTLCTPSVFLSSNGKVLPILPLTGPRFLPAGNSLLSQDSRFDNYCASRMSYLD